MPESPAQQRWRIDTVSGKVYTGLDENYCLARLAPSGVGFSLGTRPCAAVSEVWKFASRGPLEPPVGDQMIRLVNPADPYKQPPAPESCLTADYDHLPLSRVWFQPCATPAPAAPITATFLSVIYMSIYGFYVHHRKHRKRLFNHR